MEDKKAWLSMQSKSSTSCKLKGQIDKDITWSKSGRAVAKVTLQHEDRVSECKVDKPLGLITWHKVSLREGDVMEGVNSKRSSIGTDEVAITMARIVGCVDARQ